MHKMKHNLVLEKSLSFLSQEPRHTMSRPNFTIPGFRTYPLSERIPATIDPVLEQLKQSDPAAYLVHQSMEEERMRQERIRLIWGSFPRPQPKSK